MAKIRNAELGDGTEKSPVLKVTHLNLKNSDEAKIGAGMTNPASDFYHIHLVQSYSDYMPLCHFTAAAVKKSRRK